MVDEVYPIVLETVEEAKRIVLGRYGLSARDALHLAVVQATGSGGSCAVDAGLDTFPGIERLS